MPLPASGPAAQTASAAALTTAAAAAAAGLAVEADGYRAAADVGGWREETENLMYVSRRLPSFPITPPPLSLSHTVTNNGDETPCTHTAHYHRNSSTA